MPLPSLSKKRDAAPAVAPAWHPDFRDFERLPDTKVVRTSFFINVASAAAATLVVGYVGWQEFHTISYRQQAAAAQEQIDRSRKESDAGLRLTKQFNDEERKFAEAATFAKGPVPPTEMLATLGSSLPAGIQLEYLDFRPFEQGDPRCVLRGLASGSKDQASGAASAYVETLRSHPRFAELFASVNLTALNADPRTGGLVFEIVLKFKTSGGKK